MSKKFFKTLLLCFTVVALFMTALTSVAAPSFSDSLPCMGGMGLGDSFPCGNIATRIRATAASYKGLEVYVGGMPFGVKFLTEGVMIVGLCEIKTDSGSSSPACDAGLRQNDIIIKVNGVPISDAASLTHLTENSGGKPLDIVYSRDGKETAATLTPAKCSEDGKYKTGMYVRDSGAGIGTVTYILPETYAFGGLGHGICDGDTGKLIAMQRGSVVGVTINGVVKGLSGAPGEVKGYFSSGKTGTLLKNTECGVFGAFASLPDSVTGAPIPIGTRDEVKSGKAYILSTLDGAQPQKYEIEISAIRLTSTGNKCFNVKVTDKALLEKTGGIIQGMSGSPIIQNGKLVGAVTHVLVNDPATGYGIFIENMLNAAQMPMTMAS